MWFNILVHLIKLLEEKISIWISIDTFAVLIWLYIIVSHDDMITTHLSRYQVSTRIGTSLSTCTFYLIYFMTLDSSISVEIRENIQTIPHSVVQSKIMNITYYLFINRCKIGLSLVVLKLSPFLGYISIKFQVFNKIYDIDCQDI